MRLGERSHMSYCLTSGLEDRCGGDLSTRLSLLPSFLLTSMDLDEVPEEKSEKVTAGE